MATTAPPLTSPVAVPPLPPQPTPNRPSSAPSTAAANATSSSPPPPPSEHVSEAAYEFLLAEIIQWVERDEKRIADEARRMHQQQLQQDQQHPSSEDATGVTATSDEAAAVMAAERSAARIERMGYDVGYRLCERLAQHRPLLGPGSPSPEATGTDGGGAFSGGNPLLMGGGGHLAVMDPKTQLEAVKFLCKGEFIVTLPSCRRPQTFAETIQYTYHLMVHALNQNSGPKYSANKSTNSKQTTAEYSYSKTSI
ncbi:hypothetical protein ACHAWX_003604 [Stephanocyclus meneghinianus]